LGQLFAALDEIFLTGFRLTDSVPACISERI
jgi:hypothetical protein